MNQMLQSFIVTCDSVGLCSLKAEEFASTLRDECDESLVRFWAILDTSELPSIHHALMQGNRGTAMELIALQALSLGRVSVR